MGATGAHQTCVKVRNALPRNAHNLSRIPDYFFSNELTSSKNTSSTTWNCLKLALKTDACGENHSSKVVIFSPPPGVNTMHSVAGRVTASKSNKVIQGHAFSGRAGDDLHRSCRVAVSLHDHIAIRLLRNNILETKRRVEFGCTEFYFSWKCLMTHFPVRFNL